MFKNNLFTRLLPLGLILMILVGFWGHAGSFPREQYARTYVLMPLGADFQMVEAVIEATWDEKRYTIGGSADDAGIGRLEQRRVITFNPSTWTNLATGEELEPWFNEYYPGLDYVPIENVSTPAQLKSRLTSLSLGPIPTAFIHGTRLDPSLPGGTRIQYQRTYILIPPGLKYDENWALAAAKATWDQFGMTIGSSADDAGIGDLDDKRVIAVNPSSWPDPLEPWFNLYYPAVQYSSVEAETPAELETLLSDLLD